MCVPSKNGCHYDKYGCSIGYVTWRCHPCAMSFWLTWRDHLGLQNAMFALTEIGVFFVRGCDFMMIYKLHIWGCHRIAYRKTGYRILQKLMVTLW